MAEAFAPFAALTLGFSPLAFVFLCLVLFALLISRKQVTRRVVFVAIGLAAVAGAELVVLELFPSRGVYPFNPIDLAAVLAICTIGGYFASRGERGGAARDRA